MDRRTQFLDALSGLVPAQHFWSAHIYAYAVRNQRTHRIGERAVHTDRGYVPRLCRQNPSRLRVRVRVEPSKIMIWTGLAISAF